MVTQEESVVHASVHVRYVGAFKVWCVLIDIEQRHFRPTPLVTRTFGGSVGVPQGWHTWKSHQKRFLWPVMGV